MGCTHNAKKTGVLCQLSVQPLLILPSCVKTQLHVLYCHCESYRTVKLPFEQFNCIKRLCFPNIDLKFPKMHG